MNNWRRKKLLSLVPTPSQEISEKRLFITVQTANFKAKITKVVTDTKYGKSCGESNIQKFHFIYWWCVIFCHSMLSSSIITTFVLCRWCQVNWLSTSLSEAQFEVGFQINTSSKVTSERPYFHMIFEFPFLAV
jgi:hypothetical protein